MKTGSWTKEKVIAATSPGVAANIFIGFDGEKCAAGAKAAGVTQRAYGAGELVSVAFIGTPFVEAGSGGWNAGDYLAADSDGKGVVAGAGDEINAQAITDADQGDVQEVFITRGATVAS